MPRRAESATARIRNTAAFVPCTVSLAVRKVVGRHDFDIDATAAGREVYTDSRAANGLPHEVVAALGVRGERSRGLQSIRLDSIVGTVDSRRDFDRKFRPTSSRIRARWERLALAQRMGESVPPIDVFRIGDLHFVKDGHHRVSVALATGQKTIDAHVTEVITAVSAKGIHRRGDLLVKDHGTDVAIARPATAADIRQTHGERSVVLRRAP